MAQPRTYAELQACLLAWLDDSAANINPAECIGLAEPRLSRLLNVPEMEASTTLAVSQGVAALPADFREARSCQLVAAAQPILEPSTPAAIRARFPADRPGQPIAYAIGGAALLVAPQPATDISVLLTYKQAIPPLSDAQPSNWLLAKHPDLYVAASLAMAELRGWNDARLPLLKGWYDELVEEVNGAGQHMRLGGGTMRMQPRRGSTVSA